jgi:hypothetical protein
MVAFRLAGMKPATIRIWHYTLYFGMPESNRRSLAVYIVIVAFCLEF